MVVVGADVVVVKEGVPVTEDVAAAAAAAVVVELAEVAVVG